MNAAASPGPAADRGAFSRGGALALVAVGSAVFLALLYLISAGESLAPRGNDGQAHAAANGLNGYAGLARLLEAEGYDVTRSRSPGGFLTNGILVLTPPSFVDPEEIAEILSDRENTGPTLVILPKWNASGPPPMITPEARAKFKRGWVVLNDPFAVDWAADLPAPYGFTHLLDKDGGDNRTQWAGLGVSGRLPAPSVLHVSEKSYHEPLVVDAADRWLAVRVLGAPGSYYRENAHWTIFVAEPDLVNNFGLAERTRAEAALALVRELDYDGEIAEVTFDLTLNGFGGSENLLTLAFRPPFLAATLCLLLALLVVGWRAFQRFGPAAVPPPAIAFGKQRLIANGAGLIVRAKRMRLLARPYGALSARRIAERLGLARPDPDAIDAALARRLPGEEPFSRRAARLEAARRPADILSAAKALDDLAITLSQGK